MAVKSAASSSLGLNTDEFYISPSIQGLTIDGFNIRPSINGVTIIFTLAPQLLTLVFLGRGGGRRLNLSTLLKNRIYKNISFSDP